MMRGSDEQMNFYKFKLYNEKYRTQSKEQDPEWQFQNVQSVYEVTKEVSHNHIEKHQGYDQQAKFYQKQTRENNDHLLRDFKKQKNNLQDNKRVNGIDYRQGLREYEQRIQRNRSSKANSETNVISENQSLQYLSSQQPSFSSKGQFTVLDDFNSENSSKEIVQRTFAPNVKYEDWQVASFAPENNFNLRLKQNCLRLYESVQELKFMKEGFESKLKQQKSFFANELQEIKKVLFKLNIKYEKQILQFTKSNPKVSRQSSLRQSTVGNDGKQNQLKELRIYCQKLQEDKAKGEQRYQSTLRKYQQQIDIISQQFQMKLAAQRNSNFHSNQQKQHECDNCLRLVKELQNNVYQNQNVQIWKNRLFDERQKHALAMKRLEEHLFSLQQEFEYLQKNKIESEKAFKDKQKQIDYRESQIEYRLKDIERRQRDYQMASKILQKEKDELEKKKQKIADYEFKVLRQERKQKNQLREKETMASQYFNNCEKRKILSKGNSQLQRSDSVSSRGSRIDINARLKQIQMLKKRESRNYEDNEVSRNSSRDSRYSGLKDYSSSRVINSTKNLKEYGMSPPMQVQKQFGRGENSQTIKLSQKLNRLTETLQSQLRQMG